MYTRWQQFLSCFCVAVGDGSILAVDVQLLSDFKCFKEIIKTEKKSSELRHKTNLH